MYLNNESTENFSVSRNKAKEVSDCHEKEILLRLESQLRQTLDPDYNWIFSKIAQVTSQGVKFLCDFRSDVLVAMKVKNISNEDRSALKTMSSHLNDLLSHWFSAGLLELEQITWQSSCAMLQKISDYEAVHPIKNWTDLKVSQIFLPFGVFRHVFFVKSSDSVTAQSGKVLRNAITFIFP